jgi:hypothetical protein
MCSPGNGRTLSLPDRLTYYEIKGYLSSYNLELEEHIDNE